jgi:isocitrate dehydrogenase
VGPDGVAVAKADVIALLQRAEAAGVDFIKTEHLVAFDGVKAYSLGQGE